MIFEINGSFFVEKNAVQCIIHPCFGDAYWLPLTCVSLSTYEQQQKARPAAASASHILGGILKHIEHLKLFLFKVLAESFPFDATWV